MIKTLSKVGTEGPRHNKGHIQKPTANIILNGQRLKVFPLRLGMREVSAFTTLIQHSTGSPSHSNQTRRKKRHPNCNGRSKTVIIHRHNDSVHRKPYRLHQKPTLPNKYIQQSSGIQINIQKVMAALYTNNEPSVRGTKKTIPFTITTQKIKYLGINLTKEIKDLYSENYRTLKKKLRKIQISGSIYHVHH